MQLAPVYPTPQHARSAEVITHLFANDPAVDTVLLMGSCARGKAGSGSCLDILILSRPEVFAVEEGRLKAIWEANYPSQPAFGEMLALGPFSHVDLDFVTGAFDPAHHQHGWTSGADEFELEVGNTLAYSVPLGQSGRYYQELCVRWLPYYDEGLRRERLAMVLRYMHNNLRHIPLYAPRELYFQSFKRLYHAFEEFLQALFISRRTYPIAYDKWVQEGVAEILGLPELYAQLPHLLEIQHFESLQVLEKARELDALARAYMPEDYQSFVPIESTPERQG